MKKIFLSLTFILVLVSTNANAEWWGYQGDSRLVRNWGGICPDKAYRDLHPNSRQRVAEQIVSLAIERDRHSVRYASALATWVNIRNLTELARTGIRVHNAVRRGRYR